MRKSDVDPTVLHELVGRLFPPPGRCAVERTEAGVSTQVYRIRCGGDVFYLRVAEERDASLAPEVRVHELLRERGVKVPGIVYFEPFDERLQRSIMVTTAIRGKHVQIEHILGHARSAVPRQQAGCAPCTIGVRMVWLSGATVPCREGQGI